MTNILITSAGRRVELVRAFIEQVSLFVPGGKIHAIDCFPHLSSACRMADVSSISPKVDDPSYPEYLLEYALKHNIKLIIPTIDTELLILASEKSRFKRLGVDIVVSETKLVSLCRDKRKTSELFQSMDIEYPEIYSRGNIKFPCFIKPFDGSSSVNSKKIASEFEMSSEDFNNNRMIFMKFIGSEYDEYSIDAYYSNGLLKCLVPRKRLEVRAGEISKGLTVKSWLYDYLKQRLMNLNGASGCLTIQVFVNDRDRHCVGIEINPRFGGGYPLSFAAGANYPKWLIQEFLLNERVEFFDEWEAGLLMLRYDAMVLVKDAEYL